MATYQMENGLIVKTENAIQQWEENTTWDGQNRISVNTGSQWNHETLYLSKKGNYYIESYSQWQGSNPEAKFVTPKKAAAWLILNKKELPEDLKRFQEEIEG